MKKISIYNEYYKAQESLEKNYGKDSLVLLQVGSFYEIYGVDLPNKEPPIKIGKPELAHNLLGMNLSFKDKSKPHSLDNPYLVGFPDYALDEHLGKLLRANLTVAIYNQYNIDDKKNSRKGRRCEHIYSPSTYIDETQDETNNLLVFEFTKYISPITRKELKKVHIAILSVSVGKLILLEAYDTNEDNGKAEAELYRIIHTYNPSEIICCGETIPKFRELYDLGNKKIHTREIPNSYRKISYQKEFLKKIYYSDNTLELVNPIEDLDLDRRSSVIPHCIQALQYAFEQDKFIVKKIQKPEFIESDKQLILNNDSIYQLNLVSNNNNDINTLYNIICKAKTAMGRRAIKLQLLSPNININELEERYDLIEIMQKDYSTYEELLRNISDIEKKYRRMVLRILNPYELADLQGTFDVIKKLLRKAKTTFKIPEKVLNDYLTFYNEYTGNFNFELMKMCKINDIKVSFFTSGVNVEIDKIDSKILEAKELLNKIAKDFSLHIDSNKDNIVKVSSTDKDGYYLMTTKSKFKSIEEDFSYSFKFNNKTYIIKKSLLETITLMNSIKIYSPEIKIISNEIMSLYSIFKTKILEEYYKVLNHYVNDFGELFLSIISIITKIDTTYSIAKIATENGYSRPIIKDKINGSSYVQFKSLRHPIIEKINQDQEYITNDISIGLKEHYGSIIYGLNMSGKCFAKDTKIMISNGKYKKVQDITVGSHLMGDDNSTRIVLETTTGYSKMYDIIPKKGPKFTVTPEHILCLKGRGKYNILFNKEKTVCFIGWFYKGIYYSKFIYNNNILQFENDINNKINEIKNINNDYVEITVKDYLEYTEKYKDNYILYKGKCRFHPKDISIDPYRIGVLVGSGKQVVPNNYMYNDENVQIPFLAGIIDGNNQDNYSVVLRDQKTLYDVFFITHCLGINSYIEGNSCILCGSKVYILPINTSKKMNENFELEFDVKEAPVQQYYGFVLDGNKKFLLHDFTVSHNSSLLKSVGCNIVMAQAGMFVSCDTMKFYPYRNLLSKMTIKDNMSKGQSTFMVEMIEVKNMLMRADKNTLILSDELCSSTESTSGHAIVAQTLNELSKRKTNFLFSTHLHELQNIPLITENKSIKIYHFKVHIDGKQIIWDRHLDKGGMTDLYGLEVARAMGLPDSFMRGAFVIRDFLTKQPSELLPTKTSRYNSNLYIEKCSKCGSTENLHTHHIKPQKDANEKGLINNRFHKNSKFNLVVLCKNCHEEEHHH